MFFLKDYYFFSLSSKIYSPWWFALQSRLMLYSSETDNTLLQTKHTTLELIKSKNIYILRH